MKYGPAFQLLEDTTFSKQGEAMVRVRTFNRSRPTSCHSSGNIRRRSTADILSFD